MKLGSPSLICRCSGLPAVMIRSRLRTRSLLVHLRTVSLDVCSSLWNLFCLFFYGGTGNRCVALQYSAQTPWDHVSQMRPSRPKMYQIGPAFMTDDFDSRGASRPSDGRADFILGGGRRDFRKYVKWPASPAVASRHRSLYDRRVLRQNRSRRQPCPLWGFWVPRRLLRLTPGLIHPPHATQYFPASRDNLALLRRIGFKRLHQAVRRLRTTISGYGDLSVNVTHARGRRCPLSLRARVSIKVNLRTHHNNPRQEIANPRGRAGGRRRSTWRPWKRRCVVSHFICASPSPGVSRTSMQPR